MELATVRVSTSEHNELIKNDVTPAEAVIYARLHEGNTKGNPIGTIIVTGETDRSTPAERERLAQKFTGNIGKGKDVKPALLAVFPDPMRELPQTFDEVVGYLGAKAEVTTEEEVKAVAEAIEEVKAKAAAKKEKKAKKAKDSETTE